MEAFGKFCALILGLAISAILSGYVLLKCWVWFLVPLGIPALQGYAHAFGVALIVKALTYTYVKDERESAERIIAAILGPILILFFAWLYHSCM